MFFLFISCSKREKEKSYNIKGPAQVINAIKPLLGDFLKKYPHLKLTLSPVEDARAIASYLDGTCDFAIASRYFTLDESNYAITSQKSVQPYPITRDAVSVIVSEKNPLKDIKYEILKRILTHQTTDWPDVINDAAVSLRAVGRQKESDELLNHSKNLFGQTIEVCVLNNLYAMHEYLLSRINVRYFSRKTRLFNSSEELMRYVSRNLNAIGFISSVMNKTGCKTLSIDGKFPDEISVLDRVYPLTRKYYFFLPRSYNNIEMIDFIFYLRSKKVRRQLALSGFNRP
jgi:ABC-type phosphate transport system substrate-binding protein